MSTLLLTWNPARWPWNDLEAVSQKTADGVSHQDQWSTGKRRHVATGDRVYLLKQGELPRGIIASGRITSDTVSELPHYIEERAAQGDTALRAEVEFERILNPAIVPPLFVEDIEGVYWNTQSSGIEIAEPAAAEVERRWERYLLELDGAGRLNLSATKAQAEGLPEYQPADGNWRVQALQLIRARRGQQAFRDALRKRYGDRCLVSGCRLVDALESAHIKPYRGQVDHHPANGLLLRADLHTLFDLNLIGVVPGTLIVRVHPTARERGYGEFEGVSLGCGQAQPSAEALALRWLAFERRQRQP
jgi:hypothetical protein